MDGGTKHDLSVLCLCQFYTQDNSAVTITYTFSLFWNAYLVKTTTVAGDITLLTRQITRVMNFTLVYLCRRTNESANKGILLAMPALSSGPFIITRLMIVDYTWYLIYKFVLRLCDTCKTQDHYTPPLRYHCPDHHKKYQRGKVKEVKRLQFKSIIFPPIVFTFFLFSETEALHICQITNKGGEKSMLFFFFSR